MGRVLLRMGSAATDAPARQLRLVAKGRGADGYRYVRSYEHPTGRRWALYEVQQGKAKRVGTAHNEDQANAHIGFTPKGEGSRGGQVIGHTKSGKAKYLAIAHTKRDEARRIGATRSGKAVYHIAYHRGEGGKGFSPELAEHYSRFSAEDHDDAASISAKHAETTAHPALRAMWDARVAHHRESAQMVRYAERTGGRSLIDDAKDGHIRRGRDATMIGETQSGRPIYDRFDHPAHENFTAQDHHDAMEAHHAAREQVMHDIHARRRHSSAAMLHADAIGG